jgi:polyisoprenyl-teichoic acid--peptidoglycan teichoic acid transferase
VHVDPATEQVTMMSVPRDLWVSIPDHGEDKINAAYAIGETANPGGGPALVAQTIEANFGIRVPYWATVDFDGFRKIVNTIGGVVVDVPAPLKDDLYPTENLGVTRVYFTAGLQKMNGEQALEYARTRHGDNDIARGDRQQQMLLAIREQAISLGLITQANELIGDLGDSVRTDLNFNQLLALANLGRKVDSSKIVKVNLWDLGVIWEHNPVDDTDPFYWGADWDSIYGLMDQYFNAQSSADAGAATPASGGAGTPTGPNSAATSVARSDIDLSATVVAQNASDVNLLATNAVRLLRDAGFSNALPDTADTPSDTTVIYDNTDNPATARFVAQTLGIPESAIMPNPDPDAADIVVVLGADAPVAKILGP